jgi:hypothetical protein
MKPGSCGPGNWDLGYLEIAIYAEFGRNSSVRRTRIGATVGSRNRASQPHLLPVDARVVFSGSARADDWVFATSYLGFTEYCYSEIIRVTNLFRKFVQFGKLEPLAPLSALAFDVYGLPESLPRYVHVYILAV